MFFKPPVEIYYKSRFLLLKIILINLKDDFTLHHNSTSLSPFIFTPFYTFSLLPS